MSILHNAEKQQPGDNLVIHVLVRAHVLGSTKPAQVIATFTAHVRNFRGRSVAPGHTHFPAVRLGHPRQLDVEHPLHFLRRFFGIFSWHTFRKDVFVHFLQRTQDL